uniref:Uncharacterized protein n=1 Tax=Anguilla anguilla TaxID=7936 RepID=A0A0E9QQI9_ANGAN
MVRRGIQIKTFFSQSCFHLSPMSSLDCICAQTACHPSWREPHPIMSIGLLRLQFPQMNRLHDWMLVDVHNILTSPLPSRL